MAGKYTLEYSGHQINDLLKKVENTPEISLDGYATETYVNNAVNPKADTNYVNEKVAPKADKTYVDEELDKKANAIALNGLASEDYVDQKVADLVNSAPKTLDTLGELADAIQDNQDVIGLLEDAVATKANASDVWKFQYNRLPEVTDLDYWKIAFYTGEPGYYQHGAWYRVDRDYIYTVGTDYIDNGITINAINQQTFGNTMVKLYPNADPTNATRNNITLECYTVNKAENLYNLCIHGDYFDKQYATNKELGINMTVTAKSAMGQSFTRNESKITADFFANVKLGEGDTRARIAETENGYWIGLSWTRNAEDRKYIKVALNDPNDVETHVLWYWHSVNGISYDETYIELPDNFGTFTPCPTHDYEQVILDYIVIECPYIEMHYSGVKELQWKLLDEPMTKEDVTQMINDTVAEQINGAITGVLEGSY